MITPNPFVGTLFHALGGFAAASFYLPFKKVRKWNWETYWVVGGVQLWIICPLIVALVTVPNLLGVYQESSSESLALTFLLGIGWGVGHLTFGLSLRYLGLSLGMGLTLGLITFFGSLFPPLVEGTFLELFEVASGRFSLGGLLVCMIGVFFCSWAGVSKERELSDEAKKKTIQEFNFAKGVAVALFSGVMSSCFAVAVAFGDPIQKLAQQHGAQGVYANNAPFLLTLVGGGVANITACLVFNLRNGTGGNYTDPQTPLATNYFFCTVAGVIAYLEFFFYGMGESQMGDYGFSSWPIHMAFIIVLSNVWGLIFHEWRGTSTRTKFLLFLGLLALVASTLVIAYGSHLKNRETKAVDLRCEYLVDPLGIDVVKPRLSWILESERRARKQTFYQVLVASSRTALDEQEADLWNSGKVKSDQSIQVEYDGQLLKSRMRCYWKVRVWDNEEAASAWSQPSLWSMGLLNPGDWKASWIGLDGEVKPTLRQRLPARMLRREFDVRKKIQRATAYVCGLGLFELYVNGQKVGDHLRDPSLTAYDKRCLYVTFDLTERMRQGKNAVGVLLGNGRFFSPLLGDYRTYGLPRLRLQVHIDHDDGTSTLLVSNTSWKVTDDGPIRANSEFDGEEYDARKEQTGWDQPGFDDAGWKQAQRMKPPGVDLIEGEEYLARKAEEEWDEPQSRPTGDMVAQVMEPMRVTGTVRPVGISEPKPGVYVLDMGQAFYGTLKLKVSGPAGTKVEMVSAYSLRPDGTLKTEDNRDARSTDTYILKGTGEETWTPRFKGQGFRRVEITGFPGIPTLDNFEGLVVHSDFEDVGSFSCSNAQVNQLYQNIRWTQRAARRGLPHGEADRDERCGWLADVSTACESDAHNWNVAAFYTKFLEDIRLDQKPDGHLPDSVAVMWGYHYRGSLVWNRAAMMIPEFLYNFYGDRRILEEQYDCMKKWMLFVGQYQKRDRDKSKDPRGYYYFESDYDKDDYTINHNNYGSFADATTMDGGNILGATNRPLMSTAFHYNNCRIMARVARLLGQKDDAEYFSELAKKTAEGFHNRFFDPATNTYAGQTQLSYLLPLAFDMVPQQYTEAVIKNFVDDTMIKHDAHVTYGELGTQFVMQALTTIGHPEVGYALTQQTTRPSWGYMISKGATTIWERWDSDTAGSGMNSEVMLALSGNLNAWLYRTLGGINYDPEQPGFKHIILYPRPVGDLTFVQASLESIHGQIVSHWKIQDNAFHWEVLIPPNTTATVYVPVRSGNRVTESGQDAKTATGVRFLRRTKQSLVFSVGSGKYRFVSK